MKTWESIVAAATERINGSDIVFFRGHADTKWPLVPTLGRKPAVLQRSVESILYFDFLTLAGPHLPEDRNSWRTVFLMQHHGLPTRLLDWSGSFAVALFFALKRPANDAAVWMLDPFALNKATWNSQVLLSPFDLDGTYEEMFIEESKKMKSSAVAIAPPRHHPRLFHEGGYFTLHRDPDVGLEKLCPSALQKIDIPGSVFPQAREFLELAGINEFSLFSDLDGLARHLKKSVLNEEA